jgi:hypothetical protein
MPQQTSLFVVSQSLSAPQVRIASVDGSQTCLDVSSDVRTHAWPCVVSHIESSEQKRGHDLALWQTLVPLP